jgi:peroxin-6
MVTNIEHDVLPVDTAQDDDIVVGCMMGEYGCWVDTAMTRMVQAGIEHARVPDAASYLGLGEFMRSPRYYWSTNRRPSS